MGQGLENVRKIYLEGIAGGDARQAVEQYTGHRYTQHSTGVPDGAEGFLAFFEPFLERNPEREISIVRMFEDGPWVFCSAYQSLNGGDAKWVTTDMFYCGSDGLILEHWDTIAAYVEVTDTKSVNDMVGGPSTVDETVDTATTKALVLEYTKQVLQEGDATKLDHFVAVDLIERGAVIGAGREGLADWIGSDDFGSYEFLFNLIGQGDFAMTYGKRHVRGKDVAVFDIYRVSGGKIVEHWMNEEEIGPRENWGNSGKF